MSHRAHQEKTERTNSYGAGHCFSFSFTYLRGKGGREKKRERKKERETERERRERERPTMRALVYWSTSPNAHSSCGWTGLKPAGRNCPGLPHGWQGPKHISQDMLLFWVQEVRIGSKSQDLTPRTDHRPLHPCLIFCTKPCPKHAPSLMSFK